ncbi:MAG: glycosyltransferase family 4 protein [Desulfamplus sp.]|nr:glycosyltransferase family 4 protein [Desulfamplus sp.]
MKILHLISQAPDFTGSGKYIQAMLRCASEKGHENYLVAGVQDQFSMDTALIPEKNCRFVRFKGEDIPYPLPGMSDAMPYESTRFSKMSREDIQAYEMTFKRAIIHGINDFLPDVIHSHHLWIVSGIACEVSPSIPVVTTCHGTCLRQYVLCPDIAPGIGPSCRKITRVIALSHHHQNEIEKLHAIPRERIDVIPGGFDDTLFYPGEKPLPLPWGIQRIHGTNRTDHMDNTWESPGYVEILYAGKLCRAKGVPWLLNALKQVDTRHFPWRLHLAGRGSGEEEKHCLDLAKTLGHRVVVHGALSHKALGEIMRKSHIFVLPSFFEGLPLVVMEALACGCRVLTTALPGTREVLGQGNSDGWKDFVTLMDLPPLETIDKPFDKDIPLLEGSLAHHLHRLIGKVMDSPDFDPKASWELTRPYAWKTIFDRIERVYMDAILYPENASHFHDMG